MLNPIKVPIERTVELLYDKMLHDTALKHFFHNADMDKLKRKQEWFLESVLLSKAEGAADYIQESHGRLVKELGLNETHFNLMVTHMKNAMDEATVSKADQDILITAIGHLKEPLLAA